MLLNKDWIVYEEGHKEKAIHVDLPDDRMLSTNRDINSPGGVNISFFAGGKYIYEKDLDIFLEDGETVFFEFEGVYAHPTIIINGQEACHREYGYTDFIFEATPYIKNGTNHIEVIADNSKEPNSRWYTGSGIYRPVHMWILPKAHILPRSVRITTTDYQKGEVLLEAKFSQIGKGMLRILDNGSPLFEKEFEGDSLNETISIPNAKLWNVGRGNLYEAEIRFEKDEAKTKFGIRQIELNKNKGFLINGERVILKGCCIHHDNGLLGAIDDKDAEARRADLLFKSGYNAIRSAHNPISRYFMEEADRIGLLILDEYADAWYIHKTMYDCASFVTKTYKEDLKDMIDKDYNHPSVIMYSLGNEVAETSEKRGVQFVRDMYQFIKGYDVTRPITCGVNIFFNALYSWGLGQYSDKKAARDAKKKPTQKKASVGSQFFNDLAGLLGADFMKMGATLHRSDIKTRDAFKELDVAGYNYGIKRYKKDLKKYPDRFIVGSETFCSDAFTFIKEAERNPRLIGDFVWSGWDYLGEAGVGSWVALEREGMKEDKTNWLLAGSGRLDILGHPCAEMTYTRVAYGYEKIGMACVSPKDLYYGHSASSWKLSWAHRSYDYTGWEGKKMVVEVYSKEPKVALYQNGKMIGVQKQKGEGRFYFKVKYVPGTVEAISYDENGKEYARTSLSTVKKETFFEAIPEKDTVRSDETAYIRLNFVDQDGKQKPLENNEIKVLSVTNGKLLGLGNACPYYTGSYLDNVTTAYYGRAQAIIRPLEPGEVKIVFETKCGKKTVTLFAKENLPEEDFHI